MADDLSPQEARIGYLSTVESADHGFFGGYLVVSLLGRPLEFHCTAPVQPSRAQQILYGPTLRAYLLGEQIGGALLAQAKLRPNLVLVDQVDAICPLSHKGFPVVLMAGQTEEAAAGCRFVLGGCQWELPAGFEGSQQAVMDLLERLAKHVDLAEPFGRIHEAIHEAQRIGGRRQESQSEAA